jgi:hypothetical protein
MAEAHCDIDVPEKYETMVTELGARFLDNHKVAAIIDGADSPVFPALADALVSRCK